MNCYILTFDPFASNFSYSQLLAFIRDNRKIFQYYCPYSGSYFLKSPEDLVSLQSSFTAFFETSSFVVSKIEPTQTGGFLPPAVWSWLTAGTNPFIPGP
jgi:hypothetical protein